MEDSPSCSSTNHSIPFHPIPSQAPGQKLRTVGACVLLLNPLPAMKLRGTEWSTALKMISNGGFLDSLKNYDKDSLKASTIKNVQKLMGGLKDTWAVVMGNAAPVFFWCTFLVVIPSSRHTPFQKALGLLSF